MTRACLYSPLLRFVSPHSRPAFFLILLALCRWLHRWLHRRLQHFSSQFPQPPFFFSPLSSLSPRFAPSSLFLVCLVCSSLVRGSLHVPGFVLPPKPSQPSISPGLFSSPFRLWISFLLFSSSPHHRDLESVDAQEQPAQLTTASFTQLLRSLLGKDRTHEARY